MSSMYLFVSILATHELNVDVINDIVHTKNEPRCFVNIPWYIEIYHGTLLWIIDGKSCYVHVETCIQLGKSNILFKITRL